MSTKFGVDSSSFFPSQHGQIDKHTHTQSQAPLITHSLASVGMGNSNRMCD